MKTKKGEKEKLRSVILEKALHYLKKHGRVGAGTDQMMRYAKLTRGALYSHFKSKDDLFAEAICFDLANLEKSLEQRFRNDGEAALRHVIEDHLSEKSLKDVGNSCVFTSLSSDMQRCKPTDRALFQEYLLRIYEILAKALAQQFPKDSHEQSLLKATQLYSGLIGTLTLARTMKDNKKAIEILEAGKEHLLHSFAPKST